MLSKSLKNIRVKYSFEEEIDEGMSSSVYRVFFSGNEYAPNYLTEILKIFILKMSSEFADFYVRKKTQIL